MSIAIDELTRLAALKRQQALELAKATTASNETERMDNLRRAEDLMEQVQLLVEAIVILQREEKHGR